MIKPAIPADYGGYAQSIAVHVRSFSFTGVESS